MNLLSAAVLEPLLAAVPLLDPVPAPADVKPGWVAVFLFVGLFVVTILLWLSMRKQLRKIRFEEEPDADDDAAAPGSDAAGTENGSSPR